MLDERREFQRLRLDAPLEGSFGPVALTLIEIGVLGARVEHRASLEPRGELHFRFGDRDIRMRCEVVRTYAVNPLVSGLRFRAAVGDSGDHLRVMLAKLVSDAIESRGDPSATRIRLRTIDGDRTVRGVDAQFLSYRLEKSGWRKRHVFLPEQPASGFTVARGEDPEEMQRLCDVYQASDEEGRRLIRLFAELSISDALQIPPRK